MATAPAPPPWQTDAQFYGTPTGPYGTLSSNPGGAGDDHSDFQTSSSNGLGADPSYLAALKALGYTGNFGQTGYQSAADSDAGINNDGSEDLNSWLKANGYSSETRTVDTKGTGLEESQLVDSKGNSLAGTDRTFAPDENEDAFMSAMLGGVGFAGAAAAGAGGAASVGGSTGLSSSDAAALYGDAGYGAGSTAGAADGAGGAALQEGAYPELGGTDSANLGSDAHFYNQPGDLGNMGGAGSSPVPSETIPSGSGSNLSNLLQQMSKAVTSPKSTLGAFGSSSQGEPQGLFQQQMLANALRNNANTPAPTAMPGWIPGGQA